MKPKDRGEAEDTLSCQDENERLGMFALAVETAGHAIYMTNPDGLITYVNPEFERSTGFSPGEALGKTPRILKSGLMDDSYYKRLWKELLNGVTWVEEVVNRKKDGSLYYALQTIASIKDEAGIIQGFVAIQSDITRDKELERDLTLSESRYKTLLSSMREGVALVDSNGTIVTVNEAATRILGLTAGKPIGLSNKEDDRAIIREDGSPYPADEQPALLSLRAGVKVNEAVMGIREDGGQVTWISVNVRPVLGPNGGTDGAVVTFADITERKRRNDAIRRAAETDFLTGLKNRYTMDRSLREALGRAARYGEDLSMLFLDIDFFKRVNDRYGHETGDIVLKILSEILVSVLRDADSASRWGGEEFMVLAPHTSLDEAATLAERLRSRIEETRIDEVGFITVSIGVASHRQGDDLDSFFYRADMALYRAKKAGRNRVVLED